ncbi:MAG: ACT domain-containing protein, partial [Vicinamibacterales bacterium]
TTLEAKTNEHEGHIEMTVEINDLKHLEKVIKSLRTVEGVVEVERAVAR